MPERIVEIDAETLDVAREQLKEQLAEGARVVSERIISDGKAMTVKYSAETTEAAFAKADAEIPGTAEVLERKELSAPLRKLATVHAFDEQGAKTRLAGEASGPITIGAVRLAAAGTSGFFGIGRRPNQYEIEVFHLAQVEVVYRPKARISATVMEPCPHEWARVMSTSGTTLSVVTQCKRCGEIMRPTSVAVHDMR